MLLTHKILLKRNDFIETIEYEQANFSLDGRKFSCVVSKDYEIASGDLFILRINNMDQIEINADAYDYIEQGYAFIDKTYNLLNYIQEIPETVYEGKAETRKWYYFIGDNGCIQSGFVIGEDEEDGSPILYFTELDMVTTKTHVNLDGELEKVTLPIKHYIKNGYIVYDNIRYKMLYDEKGDIASIQDLREDYSIFPKKRKQKQWKRRTQLEFTIPDEYQIPLDGASCGVLEAFVNIKGQEYVLEETWDKIEFPSGAKKEARVRFVEIDGVVYSEKSNKNEPYPWEYSNILEYKGEEYPIQERFVAKRDGPFIILYFNSDSFGNDIANNFITAKRLTSTPTAFRTNKGYEIKEDGLGNYEGEGTEYLDLNTVTINGYNYPVTTVERLDFDGTYYDLYKTKSEKTFYIVTQNDKKVYFRKEEDYTYVLMDDMTVLYTSLVDNINDILKIFNPMDVKFISKDFNKLTYNGQDYYKEIDVKIGGEEFEEYPFIILTTPTYDIDMVAFTPPNMFIGKVRLEDETDAHDRFKSDLRSIHKNIVQGYTNYRFTTEPPLFFRDKFDDKTFIEIFNTDNIGQVEKEPYVIVERNVGKINLPVHLCTLHGTNLTQEDLVKKDFVSNESEKAINRVVDMEKDIYYPMVLKTSTGLLDENLDNNLIDATQVQFNIHLRTRDSEWNIKEDTLGDFKGIYEVDTEITPEQIEEGKVYNTFFTQASWNLFDYYEDYYKKTLEDIKGGGNKPEFYYPPSDLLGFFDFTDDDIYYQKSKIKKTFLRLSFFDSKNPKTQSLLGTSTIFMNVGQMFGKFSDKNANPDESIRYVSPKTWEGKTTSISGMREAVDKTFVMHNQYDPNDVNPGFVAFKDESERMTSQIIVDNKFLTGTSSEGFYTYLFREFSSQLHERTIYMRVQLNHAGHGVVLDMIQPMVKKDDRLTLANLSEINKEGVALKELYDLMYIPIKVKYNFNMKKYCWYLPQELVKHSENKIIFNLFEIKVSNHAISE